MAQGNDVLNAKIDNLIESFKEFKEEYNKDAASNILEHGKILAILNGNGKPGIKQEVLSNTIFRKNAQKGFWVAIAAFLGMMSSLIAIATKVW